MANYVGGGTLLEGSKRSFSPINPISNPRVVGSNGSSIQKILIYFILFCVLKNRGTIKRIESLHSSSTCISFKLNLLQMEKRRKVSKNGNPNNFSIRLKKGVYQTIE